jgi:hypothetical protein
MIKKTNRIHLNYDTGEVYIDSDETKSIISEDYIKIKEKLKEAKDFKDKKIYMTGVTFPREKLNGLIKIVKDPEKADYIIVDFSKIELYSTYVYLCENEVYLNHVARWQLKNHLNVKSAQDITDELMVQYFVDKGLMPNTNVEFAAAYILYDNERMTLFENFIKTDKYIDVSVLRSYVESQNEDMTQEAFDSINGLLAQEATVKMGLNMLNLINIENNKASVYYLIAKNYFYISKKGSRINIYKNIVKILGKDYFSTEIDTYWMLRNMKSDFDQEFTKKIYKEELKKSLDRLCRIESESLQIAGCHLDIKIVENG